MQRPCKFCETGFECAPTSRRTFCKPECNEAFHYRYNKLRYRNDSAYRESVKAKNLQRYYDRKQA